MTIRSFIMPPQALVFFAVLIGAAVGFQSFILDRHRESTVLVASAACTAVKVSSWSAGSQMDLQCGSHKDWTTDTGFIVTYLQKPGPFTCTLYENQSHAECAMAKMGKKKS